MRIIDEYKNAEKLSIIDTIFLDYEGVLTKNDMYLTRLYVDSKSYHADKFKACEEVKKEYFQCALLCAKERENNKISGDGMLRTPGFINEQVHKAFVKFAKEEGIKSNVLLQKITVKDTMPEGCERRRFSVLVSKDGQNIMYIQGTTKEILPEITSMLTESGIRRASSGDIKNIKKAAIKYGEKGFRVVVLAQKGIKPSQEKISEEDENDLTFIGLAAFRDTLKEESTAFLKKCREAGIKTVIVTEESKTAALAIAEKLEISKGKKSVLDEKTLNEMDSRERRKAVLDSVIYSRITQAQRVEIVKILKAEGRSVLSVGNGSELLVSDVQTEEKNLNFLIKMLAKGYNTYVKINSAVSYIITGILTMLFTMVCIGVLWEKFVYPPAECVILTFVLTIFGGTLILSENRSDFEQEKVYKKSRNIKEKLYIMEIFKNTLIIGITTLISYFVNLENSPKAASLAAFSTIMISFVLHAFSSKSEFTTLFTRKLFDNKYLNSAGVMCILLLHIYLFVNIPGNKMVMEALSYTSAVIVYLCSIMSFAMVQILKNPARRGEIAE